MSRFASSPLVDARESRKQGPKSRKRAQIEWVVREIERRAKAQAATEEREDPGEFSCCHHTMQAGKRKIPQEPTGGVAKRRWV